MTVGETLKIEGIKKVETHSGKEVREVFETILDFTTEFPKREFTAFEITERLDEDGIGIYNRNTIGAAFHKAATAGVVTAIGYTKSLQPSAHSRIVTLWKAA